MKEIFGFLTCMIMLLPAMEIMGQSKVLNGMVRNSATGEGIPAATILVKQRKESAISDGNGNMNLKVSDQFPLVIVVSSAGYYPKEFTVSHHDDKLNMELQPLSVYLANVVVSPTRVASSILSSPVSIERINASAIRNASTPGFYESIGHLKGVDLTTSALNFRTVSTRGFNGSGNLRLNQFMDGMDNQAPGLNFSVGNLLGMSELDVESIELLPGASSALYGSGGLNGTLLMNSKDPFTSQGFSAQVKEGVMHIDGSQRSASPFHDLSFRYAKSFNNKFAFKVNTQLIQAQDWQANDRSNLERSNVLSWPKPGDRVSDPNYDGVNVYGDEVNVDMYTTSQAVIYQVTQGYIAEYTRATGSAPSAQQIDQFLSNHPIYKYIYLAYKNNLMPKQRVSRTGYDEKDLVEYKTYNLKISGGLFYRISPATEISFVGYWGTGTTVYTGADRYSLKGVKMGQYKAEIKNKNWFLRAFTTQENAGDAYNTTALASYINESWKKSDKWFPEYLTYYSGAVLNHMSSDDAHLYARSKADSGRLMPGSADFQAQHERISKTPISKGGAMFLDKTDLWQYEGQFNLSEKIKFADVLVGGNYKQYILNSEGTLFADTAGRIKIPEWGVYLQAQKKLFDDRLTLTASGRYDKSKNYKGQFTPRFTGVIRVAKNQHFRLSYQTAFRFPITQDQYINLFTGTTWLIGALPEFAEHYQFETNPLYTSQSIGKYRQTHNPADLYPAAFNELVPEKVKSFEAGFKSLVGERLFIDVYGYISRYNHLIGRIASGQPKSAATYLTDLASSFTTKNFTYAQNLNQELKTTGFGIGMEYKMFRNYQLSVNATTDKMHDVPEDFVTFFNTPELRFNAGLANENAYKGIGFNIHYRWQDKVNWEGTFGSGVVPAYGTLDAQVSYKLSKMKTLIKVGGSNILNTYYQSAFGNPQIGGAYYVSVGYNVF
jgi:outer membrane receptor protein involved in Fe transport